MQHTPTRRFLGRAGVALALTFGVLATGVGVAGADQHHHSSWSHASSASTTVAGTVTAASTTSITITERGGASATFSVGATTVVTEGSTAATAAALATGEHVQIVPSTTTTGLATSIRIFLENVSGVVKSVSGNDITVTVRNGLTESVVVGSSTTYSKGGASASFTDVVAGTKISAMGLVDTTANALDALSVRIAAPRVAQAWVIGKVATVSGNDISVALRNGLTLSVVVGSSTTYMFNGAAGTLADVTTGAVVRAAGTVDTTANALDATSVSIGVNGKGQEMSLGLGAKLTASGHGAGFSLGGGFSRHGGHHGRDLR
jgi:hypothetical protein